MTYVRPDGEPDPLEGAALIDFLQAWVVGVTGMRGDMVRPRWQPEPPNIPDSGDTWAAIGITTRPSDNFPYVGFQGDRYVMQRHETITMLCSFYDLGDTGNADRLCAVLRDGAIIQHNRAALVLADMNLVNTGEPIAVPLLLKMRWQYRVDMPVVIRREIKRAYAVDFLIAARAKLYNDLGAPSPIDIDVDPVVVPQGA